MGSAAIRGLLKNEVYSKSQVVACDVSGEIRARVESDLGVLATGDLEEAIDGADTVLVAVKPQDLAAAGASLRAGLLPHQLIISIVAGASLGTLRAATGTDRVVRAMPNTPTQIGRGVTLWTAAHGVDEDDLKKTIRILGALGAEIFTKDERHLDMATAVSASGPAYALLVLEAWIDAAVGIGLPETLLTASPSRPSRGLWRWSRAREGIPPIFAVTLPRPAARRRRRWTRWSGGR